MQRSTNWAQEPTGSWSWRCFGNKPVKYKYMKIINVNCREINEYGRVQIPYRPEFFSGLVFTTAYVVFITAKIAFIFIHWNCCGSHRFFKFPTDVKVPWPAEVTGSRISPDNGFQSPLTQPYSLLKLAANHLQCASIIMVPSTKSFSFDFLSISLTSQRWHVIPLLFCSPSNCVLETDPSLI